MFFLWMVTLEDVCRETESSIEMRRFGGQRSEKFSIEVWVETHTKPIRAQKCGNKSIRQETQGQETKMPGVVATQQLRALTQNKGRQERITWEELVRMRSPVQIWVAAPRETP